MAFDTRWAPWKQQFSFNATQSGDISDWASSTVTNPSSNYGVNRVISAKGFVYVFNFSYPATCYRTTVTSGSLGSWTSVTTGIPANLVSQEIIWAGEYLYILGGLDYTSGHAVSSSAVYYAPINGDGSIGSWTATASLPDGVRFGSVVLIGNRIYYLGGQKVRYLVEFSSFVEDSKDTVYYADLDTYGVIGSWTTGSALPDLRGRSAAAVAGSTLYLIGGDKNSTRQSSIFTASISGDVLGSWSTSGYSLVSGICDAITCVTEDTLYVIGGIDGSNYTQYSVFYAGLNTSGAMTGALSYGTDLPGGDGLAHFDVLVTSDTIYLLGGYGNSGLESYAVEATFVGGLDDYTLTPEDIELTPSLHTNTQTFNAATLGLFLTPPLLSNSVSLYSPQVAPGAVSLSPTLLSNAQTFYNPSVKYRLHPPVLNNTQTFYAPTVPPGAVVLAPPKLINFRVVYIPFVSPGAAEVEPVLLSSTQVFYTSELSLGPTYLAPAVFIESDIFYSSTVVPGDVGLSPQLVSSTAEVFSSVLTPGDVAITPELLTGEQTFLASEVIPGDVALSASLRLTNTSTAFAPLITLGDLSMAVPYTAFQQEFFLPELLVGDVELALQALSNQQEFYSLEIYIGALVLEPPSILSSEEFYPILMTDGALPILPPFFEGGAAVYIPSIAAVGAILPEEVSGAVSVDIWSTTIDQGWAGVVIDQGYMVGTVDQQLWSGTQSIDTWDIEIAPDWAGEVRTQ